MANISAQREPAHYSEVSKQKVWQDAMERELAALELNNTWDLTDLPAGKKAIGCKWVYKIKWKPDGTVERYKTRLVAKVYTQIHGVDYLTVSLPWLN